MEVDRERQVHSQILLHSLVLGLQVLTIVEADLEKLSSATRQPLPFGINNIVNLKCATRLPVESVKSTN
jgi:hypothetical protein